MREKAENSVAHMFYGETPPHAALSYVFTRNGPQRHHHHQPVHAAGQKTGGRRSSVSRTGGSSNAISTTTIGGRSMKSPRASGIALMVDTDNTGERARSRLATLHCGHAD